MIHRDLKPENIFIDISKQKHSQQIITAKIGDFGLACIVDRDTQDEFSKKNSSEPELTLKKNDSFQSKASRTSVFSSVAGTEAYMAPEIM